MCLMHEAMADDFSHFDEGYSSLIIKLKDCISKYLGDSWYDLKKTVTEIVKDTENEKDAVYQVRWRVTRDYRDGILKSYNARRVILAIPPRAMKDIFYEPRIMTRNKRVSLARLQPSNIGHQAISSVYGVRMTKINLYFNNVWWNDPISKKLYGANTCNLPISQVYTFYADKELNDYNDIACAVTVYCDDSNSLFWADLQALGPKFQSTLQQEYSKLNPASEMVVDQAVTQFRKLFNLYDIPSPVSILIYTISPAL